MNNNPTEGSLELDVADFGPISQANIELRPLTVFIGPSNTGKSWLAILCYALHRYFSGEGGIGTRRRRPTRMLERVEEELNTEQIDALLTWAKREFGKKSEAVDFFENGQNPSGQKSFVIPELIIEPVRKIFNLQGGPLGQEIRRCFGVDGVSGLIRKASKTGAHVALRRRLSSDLPYFEHILAIKSQNVKFNATVPEGTKIQADFYDLNEEFNHLLSLTRDRTLKKNDPELRYFSWRLIRNLANLSTTHLFGPLDYPAFYLPADRTGVMHAHSVVVSALFQTATMGGIRPTENTPMLSGVLADFLEQLIEIDRPLYRRNKPRNNHATRIENTILEGAINIDRAALTDYPRFTYQPQGWKNSLPLMHASSMVSELAPVVLYLRYRVKPGNILIVEEPESHLPPRYASRIHPPTSRFSSIRHPSNINNT